MINMHLQTATRELHEALSDMSQNMRELTQGDSHYVLVAGGDLSLELLKKSDKGWGRNLDERAELV